jgi:hypothetical protein
MPTDHRLGLHDDQGRTPVSPGVSEQHPKQSISRTERWTLDRALENRQLLTEGQVLSATARCPPQISAKERSTTTSAAGMSDHAAAIDQRINQSVTIRVLANDRSWRAAVLSRRKR